MVGQTKSDVLLNFKYILKKIFIFVYQKSLKETFKTIFLK